MKQLIIISTLLILSSCAGLKKAIKESTPTLKSGKVHVTNLTFKDIELMLDVHVTNPNSFSIPFTGLDYKVNLSQKEILSGKKTDNPKLAANQTTTIQIPFKIPFSSVANIVGDIINKAELKFDINTALIFDIPVLGKRSLSFSAEQSVPVPKIPKVNVVSLKKKSTSFSGVKMELKIEIDNPNVVPVKLSDLNYNLRLNGKKLVASKLKSAYSVKKRDKAVIPIQFNIDLLSAGSIVMGMLNGSSELDYSFDGGYDVKLDVPYFNAFKKDYKTSGKIKL